MGSDLSVVNAARVSFAKESTWEETAPGEWPNDKYLSEKDQKLISYLAKHNHWSPFAHTSLTFRIKAPVFVARQLVKHQVGGVWNEVSRRYVSDEPEFFFPDTWRGKPVNAKQGSSDVVVNVQMMKPMDPPIFFYPHESLIKYCLEIYNQYLDLGVAPEQARMILPQNTMTEWWWTGSLMFFARVCKLRLDAHAQQETQDVARMINDLIPEQYKHSWKALLDSKE